MTETLSRRPWRWPYTGIWPCGAQVLTTLGINRKPDSSAKTMWAPSRAAFFLSAASLFVSSVGCFFHPAPVRAVPVSAGSIASGASTGRHGRDDTEPGTPDGSVPQCAPSSTDWSDSHARAVLEEANPPSVFVAWGPASAAAPEKSAPATPWLRLAAGHPASASPNWRGIGCAAPLR